MPDHYYQYADHAVLRMAQRDILEEDVNYVLLYGNWHLSGKRHQVTLRWNHIPAAERSQYGHLAGIVVVMDDAGKWVITTYKARRMETNARRPYMRGSSDWRRYLNDAFAN